MTDDTTGFSPPLTASGATIWFGRNFLEALIWAFAGAIVLILVLAAHRYPAAAALMISALVICVITWGLSYARRTKARFSVFQFEIFRVPVKVIVGVHSDPRGDRL